MRIFYCLAGMLWPLFTFSQSPAAGSANGIPPIGDWREHLPWNNAIQVFASGNKIHCATPYAYFTYDLGERSFYRYSVVRGLNDIGVKAMGFEPATSTTVLAYQNNNVDVIVGNRTYNLPDIRISQTPGDKSIRHVQVRQGFAYLSTGLGIIVLNLSKRQVSDTWRIGSGGSEISIASVSFLGSSIYAATKQGLRFATLTSDLAEHRNWRTIGPALDVEHCISNDSRVFALRQDSIFVEEGNNLRFFYTAKGITGIDPAGNGILVCGRQGDQGYVVEIDPGGQVIRSWRPSRLSFPRQALLQGPDCWVADQYNGLFRLQANMAENVFPNSPINIATGGMAIVGRDLWATAGSVNDAWNYTYNPNGIYRFEEMQSWKGYNLYVYPKIDTLLDFITVAGQPGSGSVFFGSYGGGMLELRKDNSLTIYKQNSPLQPAIGDPRSYRVSGLAFDADGQLWVSNYGAVQNVHVRKKDGSWRSFTIPFLHTENAVSAITIDDQNQKWIVSPKGNGLFLLNSGTSIDNTTDDRWRYFRQGKGNGNLPSSVVHCAVMDKDGFIWVGTNRGVAVITCVDDVFNSTCEATLPVIRQDRFAGYLFSDEDVLCMAVDGANRKWVGTRNGLWLVSPDGDKIIYRFSRSNSPLLSDEINALAVDGLTGEVFIATAAGICSFRSTATEATTEKIAPLVFPNPVPPGYAGSIAIRGLPENAVVRITEPDGRLVYQTRSLGGQAIWNGRDQRGNRASSGMYLVLISDDQLRSQPATKIYFIR